MIMFLLLLFALGYAAPLSVFVLLGFPLVRPHRWWLLDWIAVTLPGVSWIYLLWNYDDRGRTYSNLVELPLLALAIALLGVLRSLLDRRTGRLAASLAYLAGGLVVCLGIYFFFPGLPE